MSEQTSETPGTSNVHNKTEEDSHGSDEKSDSDKKKKQPPFLLREIKVQNHHHIDTYALVTQMYERYNQEFKKWKKKSNTFKKANLAVTLVIILIQVTQIILFQIPEIPEEAKVAIATVFPAVTAAILSIQLKLDWNDKGSDCHRTAELYKRLVHNTKYRLRMISCGGDFKDSVKLWNVGLLSECSEVPPFMDVY